MCTLVRVRRGGRHAPGVLGDDVSTLQSFRDPRHLTGLHLRSRRRGRRAIINKNLETGSCQSDPAFGVLTRPRGNTLAFGGQSTEPREVYVDSPLRRNTKRTHLELRDGNWSKLVPSNGGSRKNVIHKHGCHSSRDAQFVTRSTRGSPTSRWSIAK